MFTEKFCVYVNDEFRTTCASWDAAYLLAQLIKIGDKKLSVVIKYIVETPDYAL